MEYQEQRVAGEHAARQAHGVAEMHGAPVEAHADPRDGIADGARFAVLQRDVRAVAKAAFVLDAGEEVFHVVEQCGERVVQGLFGWVVATAIRDRFAHIVERGARQGHGSQRCHAADRIGPVAAGDGLQAQQAAEAEHEVAVVQRRRQLVVGVVRGTDPFVDVLGDEEHGQPRRRPAARLTPADPVEQGAARGGQGLHGVQVAAGKFHGQRIAIQALHGFEKGRLGFHQRRERFEQASQGMTHRPLRRHGAP